MSSTPLSISAVDCKLISMSVDLSVNSRGVIAKRIHSVDSSGVRLLQIGCIADKSERIVCCLITKELVFSDMDDPFKFFLCASAQYTRGARKAKLFNAAMHQVLRSTNMRTKHFKKTLYSTPIPAPAPAPLPGITARDSNTFLLYSLPSRPLNSSICG